MMNLIDGNNVMRRSMEKEQLSPIMSLRQRYETTTAADIWVWDGRKHNDRRRAIYPPYKMNRSPIAEDIFAQIGLWRDVLRHSTATQIEVYGWEADDVISTLARRGAPAMIHSNDMDYAQLGHLQNVTLNGVNTKGVPGRWVPLYKAMVGDNSDNIAGIPGFGPKRWVELEDYWPQIERAIVAGTSAGFMGLPFKPAVLAWLMDEANVRLLRAMLTVTHFENVPYDEIEGGIVMGDYNRQAAHDMLRRYFL